MKSKRYSQKKRNFNPELETTIKGLTAGKLDSPRTLNVVKY
jgi:hypothetical protein